MSIKTENRIKHKWGSPDEYGISECEFCRCLMSKKANTTYSLVKKRIAFIVLYSKGGTKWTVDHLPCNPLAYKKT